MAKLSPNANARLQSFLISDRASKAVWFFLPIGLLLSINGWFFIGTVRMIQKLDQESVNPGSDNQKREKRERLKTFLGSLGSFATRYCYLRRHY